MGELLYRRWDVYGSIDQGRVLRGKELSRPVEIYAAAFPDMHRELYRFFVDGDTVIVELALQGTQKGRWNCPWLPYRLRANEWTHRVATCFA